MLALSLGTRNLSILRQGRLGGVLSNLRIRTHRPLSVPTAFEANRFAGLRRPTAGSALILFCRISVLSDRSSGKDFAERISSVRSTLFSASSRTRVERATKRSHGCHWFVPPHPSQLSKSLRLIAAARVSDKPANTPAAFLVLRCRSMSTTS